MDTLPSLSPTNGKLDLAWDQDGMDGRDHLSSSPERISLGMASGSNVPGIDLGLGAPISVDGSSMNQYEHRVNGMEESHQYRQPMMSGRRGSSIGVNGGMNGDAVRQDEKPVIADPVFRPPSNEFINPIHRLSHPDPHTASSDPNHISLPSAHKKRLSKSELKANHHILTQLEQAAYASKLSSDSLAPTVHIKKVGKDSVQIIAQDPEVDAMLQMQDGSRSPSNGFMGDALNSVESGGYSMVQDAEKKDGIVKRVLGRGRKQRKQDDRLGGGGAGTTQEFRPTPLDDLGRDPSGPAPPSPPISMDDEDSTTDEDDDSDEDETSADSEDGYDDPGLIQPGNALQRQVSISGQSFVDEPMSLDQGVQSQTQTQSQTRNSTDTGMEANGPVEGTMAGSAPTSAHIPSSSTFGAERASLDRIASGGAYPSVSHRMGPIRAGSIAASKARIGGSSAAVSGSDSVVRVPSPTKRQVDLDLNAKEPMIQSTAEQAPINMGSVPLPQASIGQPAPLPTAGVVTQGAGGSYFPQPNNPAAGAFVDGTLYPTGNYLHPSSASFMSTASAGSSSQYHAGPSHQHSQPIRMERRNTSGSLQPPTNMGQGLRTPSLHSQNTYAWDQQPSLASLRRASQTEVPGLQGSALDPDILAEAEKLRRERLAKRQRKRSSGDDAMTILGGSPEPPFAIGAEAGPSRDHTASPVGHDEAEAMARRHEQSVVGASSTPQHPEVKAVVENDGSAFVGNLIGEDHVNYVLMYNMLTGIRIGVSRCQAKMKRTLAPEDFKAKHKYSFDIVGNELTPSARYDFKFKDYAPWVFRELREDYFHLDPADYLLSLTAKYILSELGSPGKSGSFFYFSRDYRFIIKTIHHAEHKYLRSILPEYHAHIKNNPHTLMSRFYGLHRVKLPRGRKIHFVIMNNLFPPHRDIHETYDLKGSALGREYPEEKAKVNTKATLKDLNWLHRGRMFELGPEKRALFGEQVKRDRDFLVKIGVMDYSLLIGIHNMERGNKDNLRENQLSVFQPNMQTAMRRKPSSVKGSSDASAMRKAVRRSDPKALTSAVAELPTSDSADRRHFLFYQDEGGLRATDEANDPMDIIYYLGVIDILTPYNTTKKLEHLWRSLTEKDRHMVSCVPPPEYGERFLAFLISFFRDADVSKRPRMELKTKTE